MTNTIAIIPARGGSKRLSQKNILMLGDLPLVAHSIIYAQSFPQIIKEVYVTTDSEEIAKVALFYGAKVINRPEYLSGDFEPTVSALKHAVDQLVNVDSVILLQPTNPLRPEKLLENTYTAFKEKGLNSLFTVSQNHKKLGKIANDKFIPFNYNIGQRSQDIEPLYYENGLLYITTVALIKKGIIFNEKSFPFIVNHKFASIDIDTQEDFDYAEYILNNYNE